MKSLGEKKLKLRYVSLYVEGVWSFLILSLQI